MAVPPTNPPPPLSIVRAWTFLGINLFATPGLGSWMGGRKTAGGGQLFFSVSGFLLITTWMLKMFLGAMSAETSETDAPPVPAWWWHWGVVLFGIAWLWSLFTSLSLVRQAHRGSANRPTQIPPRLTNPDRPVPPRL